MKKTNTLIVTALMAAALAGCTDATAKIKDGSTVLFSIGSQNITKGQAYTMLNMIDGGSTAINDANTVIAQAEIEITDEMRKEAEDSLNNYKTYYGDSFQTHLDQLGYTEQDYLEKVMIPSLQANELTNKYIQENYDSIVESYAPVKATLLSFTSQDDANAALSELKDGSAEPADAAKNHNSSSTGTSQVYTIESTDVDSMVRTVLTSGKPDDGWTMVPASDGATFIVMRIDDNDPNNFKDECITALENISQITSDSNTYWFKKYNFHIYDKTLYDAVKADYSNYLVQDMEATAETKTAAPEETAEPAEESETPAPESDGE